MHDLSYHSRPSKGFVLLHTLWLLLVATALVTGLLILATRSSERWALGEQEARREIAQESAVELVLHDLVTRGTRSPWLTLPRAHGELNVDGQVISISVQNVAGLIDAGTADDKTLAAFLDQAVKQSSKDMLMNLDMARLRLGAETRPFSTYAELRALMGASDHEFSCIYPHLTLFSGSAQPDLSFASPPLIALLQIGQRSSTPVSAMEGVSSAAGATYRIEARASDASGSRKGQVLSVEVTITGRLQPSHIVRSWLRLSQAEDNPPCD